MPFTDTHTDDQEECTRTVEHVPYRKLKSSVKESASIILQSGIEKALAAAAEQSMEADAERAISVFCAI